MPSQNHIDTEKLFSSLRIACHHPGGKKSKSPGSSVALIAFGATFSQKSGSCPGTGVAKTSTQDVLLIDGLVVFVAGLYDLSVADGVAGVYGYIYCDIDGGASHTVLRPTTCAVRVVSCDSQYN